MDEIILRKHEYTVRAKQVLKRTAEDIVELSQICAEYHKEFGYQEYIRWVQDDLGISETYGRRFLNVYKQYGSTANLAVNFNPSALYLLASPSTPESAREEALTLAESGEKVSHTQALKIVAKHKAEAEAAKAEAKVAQKELVSKQQIITNLKDRLTTLEAKKNELARENNFILENKNVDANQMMSQHHEIERLNQQIEELKAQQVEPQVITQEVKVEVIPDDYEQLKEEVDKLRISLEREKGRRTKTEKDAAFQLGRVQDLEERIAQKNKKLIEYDPKEREIKVMDILIRTQNEIVRALTFLEYEGQIRSTKQINSIVSSIHKNLDEFIHVSRIIDIEVLNG